MFCIDVYIETGSCMWLRDEVGEGRRHGVHVHGQAGGVRIHRGQGA